jgi:microcystin degradation protein MlrC
VSALLYLDTGKILAALQSAPLAAKRKFGSLGVAVIKSFWTRNYPTGTMSRKTRELFKLSP